MTARCGRRVEQRTKCEAVNCISNVLCQYYDLLTGIDKPEDRVTEGALKRLL